MAASFMAAPYGCLPVRNDHSRQVVRYLAVREADDAIALGFEVFCAFGVVFRLFQVLTPVQLNDQFFLCRAKVGDEGPDGVLTPEIDAVILISAQRRPELLLGRRELLAQCVGAVVARRAGQSTPFPAFPRTKERFGGRSRRGFAGLSLDSRVPFLSHTKRLLHIVFDVGLFRFRVFRKRLGGGQTPP